MLDRYAAKWLMRLLCPLATCRSGDWQPAHSQCSHPAGQTAGGRGFTAIIGLIKRAFTYGRLFTVSGVLSAFRKTALYQAGYWSEDSH